MYAFWALLAVGLLPLIYSHCLDQSDPGMPTSRWVLIASAVLWGLLLSPLQLPGALVLVVSLLEVVWINFVAVLSADLLWSQAEVYVIDARLAMSTSMLVAAASCILVTAILLVNGWAPTGRESDENDDGGDVDGMFDATQDPLVQSLTLFVSLSTCAVAITVGLIRRVLNRAFLNVRYNNCVLGGLIAMNSSSGLALIAAPSPWNVPLNRAVLWSVLFMALTLRKAKVSMYFAPLRDGPAAGAGDVFFRSVPLPPVLGGAPGGTPLFPPPPHAVVTRARHRVMTRDELPFLV